MKDYILFSIHILSQDNRIVNTTKLKLIASPEFFTIDTCCDFSTAQNVIENIVNPSIMKPLFVERKFFLIDKIPQIFGS
jgi:hypothetical protein